MILLKSVINVAGSEFQVKTASHTTRKQFTLDLNRVYGATGSQIPTLLFTSQTLDSRVQASRKYYLHCSFNEIYKCNGQFDPNAPLPLQNLQYSSNAVIQASAFMLTEIIVYWVLTKMEITNLWHHLSKRDPWLHLSLFYHLFESQDNWKVNNHQNGEEKIA